MGKPHEPSTQATRAEQVVEANVGQRRAHRLVVGGSANPSGRPPGEHFPPAAARPSQAPGVDPPALAEWQTLAEEEVKLGSMSADRSTIRCWPCRGRVTTRDRRAARRRLRNRGHRTRAQRLHWAVGHHRELPVIECRPIEQTAGRGRWRRSAPSRRARQPRPHRSEINGADR